MANQPTIRPWFRLASIARPIAPPQETQPPTIAPLPRPPLVRPTFTTSFRPTTTQPQEPPQPPPSPPHAAPSATVNRATSPPSPIGKNVTPKGSPSSSKIQVTSPKATNLAPNISSVPNSPVPKNLAPNSPSPQKSSIPNSPSPKISPKQPSSQATKFTVTNSPPPVRNSPMATTAARLPTSPPPSPPKLTKQPLAQTPPQSPKINYSAPLPSPLVLPPSMLNPEGENGPKVPLEAEQKTVLVQKTIEKPKAKSWLNGDNHNHVHNPNKINGDNNEKGIHKSHNNKKNSDSEESGTRIITIAGENKGAFMELNHPQNKHGHFEGNTHSLMKKHGNESHTSNDYDKKHEKLAINSPPVNAYVNNNVQGINNSIVFDSSYSHHDPGVHLSLSRNPNGDHKMPHFKDNANEDHS